MKQIKKIESDKKKYLDLLLLADEQENMIDKYLQRGDLYVLEDDGVKTVCVVVMVEPQVYEIKNIATAIEFHGKGYGQYMVKFVVDTYKPLGNTLLVGTGDSPSTVPFYNKCGFSYSHRIKNFFVDNYDEPIMDEGVQLKDMIYLKMDL